MISLFLSLLFKVVCVRVCCSSRVVVVRVIVRFLSHVTEDKMPKKVRVLFFFKSDFSKTRDIPSSSNTLFTQGCCSIHLRFYEGSRSRRCVVVSYRRCSHNIAIIIKKNGGEQKSTTRRGGGVDASETTSFTPRVALARVVVRRV